MANDFAILPDGTAVNLTNVTKMAVSGSDVVIGTNNGTDVTYTAASGADADYILSQLIAAAASPVKDPEGTIIEALPSSAAITSVSPTSSAHGANDALTINGTNLFRFGVCAAYSRLQVKINGQIAGLVSPNPSATIVTIPTLTGSGTPYLATIQFIDLNDGSIICSDSTMLTIT